MDTDERTTWIAICDGAHADGSNAAAIRSLLEERTPETQVEVIEDLCGSAARLPELVRDRGAESAVLGLCRREVSDDELQIWARRSGIDPFGVHAVDLELASRLGDPAGADGRAGAALAAAAAALRVAPATPASQLSVRLVQEGLSRRALLTLPLAYGLVAAVDQGTCVGTERCGLCVSACPVSAIRASQAFPTVDSRTCVACGACVSACPARAVGLPGANLREQEARISALLAWGWEGQVPGLVLACRGTIRALLETPSPQEWRASWLPVAVPCLSTVTPAWVLQALAGGAPSVAVLGCGGRCGTGSTERLSPRLDYCREVLRSFGEDGSPTRVRFATSEDLGALSQEHGGSLPAADGRAVVLLEPHGTADAVRRLAPNEPLGPVVHEASPLGIVSIDIDGCTLCGVCAERCPTGALDLRTDEDASLLLNGARCLACRHCQDACPERVVRVERGTETAALAGPTTVKRETIVRCERCGRPVGPPSMIRRVLDLLPDTTPELRDHLAHRCSDCRGL